MLKLLICGGLFLVGVCFGAEYACGDYAYYEEYE
jgi:hypothetical protein